MYLSGFNYIIDVKYEDTLVKLADNGLNTNIYSENVRGALAKVQRNKGFSEAGGLESKKL
jgi:hypothetical protein